MKKVLLVSHNDLDGVGAGIVLSGSYPADICARFVGYDEIDDTLLETFINGDFDEIFITDIAPKQRETINALECLSQQGITVKLFDHHDVGNAFDGMEWAHFGTDCGTMLLYRHLKASGYDVSRFDRFATLVNDYDCWIKADPDSGRLNALFQFLGEKFPERCRDSDDPGKFTEFERSMIDAYNDHIKSYAYKMASQMTLKEIHGATVAMIFADSHQSEIGQAVRDLGTSADCAMIINMGHRKGSLRSVKPDFNVGEFAKKFNNGGGRKATAGFQLTGKQLDNFIASL